MSHKVEFFDGHWWDEGLYFATEHEAQGYAESTGKRPYRVSPGVGEVDANGFQERHDVNYSWVGGRLVPYRPPTKATMSWEEYMLAGGANGMPLGMI